MGENLDKTNQQIEYQMAIVTCFWTGMASFMCVLEQKGRGRLITILQEVCFFMQKF